MMRRCLSTTTHFGYRRVKLEDKKPLVADVFHGVAEKYDLMNDAMSMGIHRLWKDEFVSLLAPRPKVPQFRVLDVAGGTGDIAFRIAETLQRMGIDTFANPDDPADIVVCDINSSMLRVGQDRYAQKKGFMDRPKLEWVEGDAEQLSFESESFDAYTIAFGIRNVTDIPVRPLERRQSLVKRCLIRKR